MGDLLYSKSVKHKYDFELKCIFFSQNTQSHVQIKGKKNLAQSNFVSWPNKFNPIWANSIQLD